jgi:hypothetical protein
MSNPSWKQAIADLLQRLPTEFSLGDARKHEAVLAQMFPQNRHIDAKIRQTLQLLRDRGQLEFLGGGRYRKLGVPPPRWSWLTARRNEKSAASVITRSGTTKKNVASANPQQKPSQSGGSSSRHPRPGDAALGTCVAGAFIYECPGS